MNKGIFLPRVRELPWQTLFNTLSVGREGVEPSRCHHRRILSPLRLPKPLQLSIAAVQVQIQGIMREKSVGFLSDSSTIFSSLLSQNIYSVNLIITFGDFVHRSYYFSTNNQSVGYCSKPPGKLGL